MRLTVFMAIPHKRSARPVQRHTSEKTPKCLPNVAPKDVTVESQRSTRDSPPSTAWDDTIDSLALALALDGAAIPLPPREGATWASPHVSVMRTRATNTVNVKLCGKFAMSAVVVPITDEELRVHSFKFHDLTEEVDDILGRTYRKNYTSRAKVGAAVHDIGPLRRGLIAPSPASVQVPPSRKSMQTCTVKAGRRPWGPPLQQVIG
uniref:Uncharacterized protein n=1 Tax=Ananas comosus var. bracteatus TaxID=296719 RepID=A0A6V7NYA8_ANACO|nr:unnamed protein product [Ananas comosus var. bracteatus]